MTSQPDYISAHAHSSRHHDEILASSICGCFYCLAIFPPSEITGWIQEDRENAPSEQTAQCPRCHIDSVIGTASGYPITTEFLKKMHAEWFSKRRTLSEIKHSLLMDDDDDIKEIDPVIYANINNLIDSGDERAENRDYDAAIELYERAIGLVPDPVAVWGISVHILAALADIYFDQRKYEKARDCLETAKFCGGGIGNPYIHLRLGQAQYELGNMKHALDELVMAYMGNGEEIFEDEDPKYFALVKANIRIDSSDEK